MGCTSSRNSVQQPSKHKIKDSIPIVYESQKSHTSVSTLHTVGDSVGKVSIAVSDSVLVLRYDFSTGDTVLSKGDLVRAIDRETYWSLVATNTGVKVHIPNSYLAKSGSLQLCEWYYECLSKHSAERKLLQSSQQPGTFLVHKKPHSEDYICTVLTEEGRSSQYVIRSEKGGYFITRRRVFVSVPVLIEVFMFDEGGDVPFRLSVPLRPVLPVVYSGYEGTGYPLEVERERVEIGEGVSVGKSSEVWGGSFNGNIVSVRTFTSKDLSPEEFTQSMVRFRNVCHKNLQLLIAFSCQNAEFLLVTENSPRGSLKLFLMKEGQRFNESELIALCAQVSNGMNCLELHDITHGNLCSQNVMIGEDDLLKICDASLVPFVGRESSAVRWTAPEVLRDYNNTSPKSDVWSLGILMIEVITLGDIPYSHLQDSEVSTQVLEGYNIPKPTDCHVYLYEMMKECWNGNPRHRPTFDSLSYRLDDFYISAEHESSPRQSVYKYLK